jgi:hypothetical protein
MRQTVPKGRRALEGSELNSGFRVGSWVLCGRTCQVDAICGVLLEVQDKVGRQVVRERFMDCSGLLVYLLDGAFDLVAVGIGSGMGYICTEET